MKKARIGVIGVGWWGTVGHLAHLAEDPKAEVVAVWSRTEEKAKARAARYGVPKAFTDYREMVDTCGLDGVVIASTPNMHDEQARYALEHGLHVLMEKPFVLQAEQARSLHRLARENELLLSVCHPLLYRSGMTAARQAVLGGDIGDPVVLSAVFAQRVYELYAGRLPAVFQRPDAMPSPNHQSYADPQVAGGGQGHTQASHIVGALLWLTGLRPAEVFAFMNHRDLDLDVVDAMTLRFDGGALGTVVANGLVARSTRSMGVEVQGEKGILAVDVAQGTAVLYTKAQKEPLRFGGDAPEDRENVAAVPRNFVRTILGETDLHVGPEVAVREVEVLDAAYRSAASGQAVRIAPDAQGREKTG